MNCIIDNILINTNLKQFDKIKILLAEHDREMLVLTVNSSVYLMVHFRYILTLWYTPIRGQNCRDKAT